ncbi:hypothetical protein CON65_02430 [Bacillus pseudomycoides]|uniref:Phage protein n=1 Tax=Bacillus pseudomycoides TaxID=64104 RepID=A0AA91ZUU1_9BACI|nr:MULTISPECIES: hypothetical protein [Bacillus]PED84311.1 hypothetical protein CON65_02430 [Bacillus pseudomycoides]PEU15838.1 hypothetical protein CN524_06135 [Bacillus sp. AFS019443]PEU19726.1 hypothetical protein CN525_06145 [Bacillus sp. AFS014408]PFW64862.1 hypothetical protein COL20_02425 [Bacillus sp. AFS075034]
MKLTKQEQAVIIGTVIGMYGEKKIGEHIDPNKLDKLAPVFNAMEDNTTPKQRREASISLLDKTIDEFLESKE